MAVLEACVCLLLLFCFVFCTEVSIVLVFFVLKSQTMAREKVSREKQRLHQSLGTCGDLDVASRGVCWKLGIACGGVDLVVETLNSSA